MAFKSSRWDIVILSVLAIFLTWHPYYLHGRLNLFELGLYLPGIDGILQGQVPFRDFFYLRGPFELYVPAFLMRVFGTQVAVLETYFYAGTVLTLVVGIAIAKELYPQRGFLYLMAVVLVARTFPRVVFTFWGGLRYAWGLMAILCLVRFLKTGKSGWIAAAGAVSAIAFWTSFEIGISAASAALAACILAAATGNLPSRLGRSIFIFLAGFGAVCVPYICYLITQQALGPFVETVTQVAGRMIQTFPQPGIQPGAGAFLSAVFDPRNPNFRQMTVLYGYLFLGGYFFLKWRRQKLEAVDMGVAALAFYGFLLFAGAFRNIWASQYEMALQPWKILQFFLLAQVWQYLSFPRKRESKNDSSWRQVFAGLLLAAVAVSSLGYAVSHMQKRFFIGQVLTGKSKAKRLEQGPLVHIDLPRTKGMVIPEDQARDLTGLNDFLQTHTAQQEKVLMYPEMGAVHFMVGRPWLGHFATATLAWLSPQWHQQWLDAVKAAQPRYAVLLKKMPDYFDVSYFQVPANRRYFDETMEYIHSHYQPVSQTPSWLIYERRGQ